MNIIKTSFKDIKTHSHIVKQLSLIDLYINIGNLIPIVLLLLGAIFMLFGLVIVVFRLMVNECFIMNFFNLQKDKMILNY